MHQSHEFADSRSQPVNGLASIEGRIARLAAQAAEMPLEELRLFWRRQFGRRAPSALPRSLLYRLLVYRIQAEAFGDLSPAIVRQLEQIAKSPKGGLNTAINRPRARLSPGTTLVREHGGAHHRVLVTEDGFSWNGQIFSSLSRVAHAITGTKWNGYRFFGLREGK